MDADHIHLSPRAAEAAGKKAVTEKRADAYQVRPASARQPDRSLERGFAVIIQLRGQTVGFA